MRGHEHIEENCGLEGTKVHGQISEHIFKVMQYLQQFST